MHGSKDQMNSFSRWPRINALRSWIERWMGVSVGHRKLHMPSLETPHLILRKLDANDLKDIIAWNDFPAGQTAEGEARKILAYSFREYRERGIGPWGIQLRATRALVGNCGFPHIIFKDFCGEMNCYIAPQHRGQGLATEALTALLKYGFREIGLTRIQGRCALDNLKSERVMLRIGMRFEGLVDETLTSSGSSSERKLYAILETDFDLASARESASAIDASARSEDHG
jgi:RimJ/RimL family protein N-acetyltransferase